LDGVLDELFDLFVAFDGDDAAATGGDFLNVAEGFFVFEDAVGPELSGADAPRGTNLKNNP
jgi:hypothetical protein